MQTPTVTFTPNVTQIKKVMEILQQSYTSHPMHEAFSHSPFQMLIAVVLSQRATDAMTIPVAKTLFTTADSPEQIVQMPIIQLEEILRPIGFYRQKAKSLKKLSEALLNDHAGKVPSSELELLALPQVGRKTANIILTMFFNTPQIAVDIHVHRISNRLGWINTKIPEETERLLTDLIPTEYISITNQVFVRHGQEICRPLSPKCSLCPIRKYCKRVGVVISR